MEGLTETDGVGVHDGNEESDNEKLGLEHGDFGGVVTGWLLSSKGICPRFYIFLSLFLRGREAWCCACYTLVPSSDALPPLQLQRFISRRSLPSRLPVVSLFSFPLPLLPSAVAPFQFSLLHSTPSRAPSQARRTPPAPLALYPTAKNRCTRGRVIAVSGPRSDRAVWVAEPFRERPICPFVRGHTRVQPFRQSHIHRSFPFSLLPAPVHTVRLLPRVLAPTFKLFARPRTPQLGYPSDLRTWLGEPSPGTSVRRGTTFHKGVHHPATPTTPLLVVAPVSYGKIPFGEYPETHVLLFTGRPSAPWTSTLGGSNVIPGVGPCGD